MFQQNLETITKLAYDAATSISNLNTAGSTACDCGDAQCSGGGPFQFLIGHPLSQMQSPPETSPAPKSSPEPQPKSERMLTLSDIDEHEVLVRICSFLTPKDLGRLASVARCFSQQVKWLRKPGITEQQQASFEMRSVIEESSRRWVMSVGAEEHAQMTQSQPQTATTWLQRKHSVMMRQLSPACADQGSPQGAD
eukprot:COSAG02_NODE_5266_length_4485_cov_2.297538_1_plen_195_part_00